jgi:hypothetical protein
MNIIPDDAWQKMLPKLRERCPRLTEQDLVESQGRVDLLTAKIQNRHWVDKTTARRTVLALMRDVGAVSIG